jgi:hypothetical protein
MDGHTDLASAIAHAEGFGVPGAIPTLAHNPGDLVMPWLKGPKMGAAGIHIFPDDATGWAALEHELSDIMCGKSCVYTRSMTILDMAQKWTITQQSFWANNVADFLRANGRTASIDTPLSAVLG